MADFSPVSIEDYLDRRVCRFPIIEFSAPNVGVGNPLENIIDGTFNPAFNQSVGGIANLNVPKSNVKYRLTTVTHQIKAYMLLINSVSGQPVAVKCEIMKAGAINTGAPTKPILYDGKEILNEWLGSRFEMLIGEKGLKQIQFQNVNVQIAIDSTNIIVNADMNFDENTGNYTKLLWQTMVNFYR